MTDQPDSAAMPLPDRFTDPRAREAIVRIARSFQQLLGRPLVFPHDDPVSALWDSPLAIVAHGTEEDPLFFFGNAAALAMFETDVAAFCGMPSRLSAEAPERSERQAMLDRVTRHGFIDDYTGMRISARGRHFRIEGGTIWNLLDENGVVHGQAAAFAA